MDDMKQTMLGLFTEVAILEHLVRMREDRFATSDLSTGDFGLLNYFMLNHPTPDSVAGIAWSFQEEQDYTRAKVEKLAARGLVSREPDTQDNHNAMVMITDAGRTTHAEILAKIAPDIILAVAEIPPDALRTTFKTLREIRLTLDNLPDR
jgi:DNA-binding MarR family transcriptional regulator